MTVHKSVKLSFNHSVLIDIFPNQSFGRRVSRAEKNPKVNYHFWTF